MRNPVLQAFKRLLLLMLSFLAIQSSYAYLSNVLIDKFLHDEPVNDRRSTIPRYGKLKKAAKQRTVSSDPIRFTIHNNIQQVVIGEELELTIKAQLMNISPNMMFFLPGSNAYTLKMLLPDGFQQTGGNLTEFVTGELAYPSKSEITYTIRGFFTSTTQNACFRLLRSHGQATNQSLFVEKATLCVPVYSADRQEAARTATFNWCVEAESGSGNRSVETNSQASGGQSVGGFGNSGEYMNYTITSVPTADSYTLHLWYTSAETPQFGLVVNGTLQTVSGSSNGSWTGPFIEKTATVSLQAGNNNMRIQGAGGSFVLDRLCVDGGSACSPPTLSLGTPTCNGTSTYSVGFTAQSGASVSSSAGNVQGNQVVNIPVGTNVTVTASLGGCSAQQIANSPTCNAPSGCAGTGLTGSYYNTNDLSQNAVVTRTDAQIDFNWGGNSPIPGTVNADPFSIRWLGQVEAPVTGTYIFKTNNDDGTRLWVNGQLLIDDWNGHGPTFQQGSISLTAGQKYTIKIEYVDFGGGAQAQLYWEYPSQTTQIVPSCRLYTGNVCTPPSLSLGTPTCNGTNSYSVGFTAQAGASVSSSAGSVQGSQVANIPVGTNVTLTASLGGCSAQQSANSPTCNSGSLVSGNCYLITNQQTSSAYNTLQAIGSQALLQSVNGQTNQIWKAESVGSQYRFTSQAGNRDQVLYVDGLSNGQPLKLGPYVPNERYQWNLATSSQGGYRVYGGSSQNTWDQQGAGSSNVLQLYGSNTDSSDPSWNQPYRRFSFSSVGCPTSTTVCTPPTLSLGTPTCNGTSTYSVGFTAQVGANVTTSAGSVQSSQVINIPVGTNVTVTASLSGCTAQQTANSPACTITVPGNIPLLSYTDQGWPTGQDDKILENDQIQVRFSKSVGGGVTWINKKPSTENLIWVHDVGGNPQTPVYDTGGLLGYSTYCTPKDGTFVVNGKTSLGIGANNVQGGDIVTQGNHRGTVEKSALVQTTDRGTVLCMRARGLFWDVSNEPGHTPFDIEAWLDGNTLRLRCNVVVEERTPPRFTQQPEYMGLPQELPCMYGIAGLSLKLGKVNGQEKNLTENIQPQLGFNSQAIVTDDYAIGMYSPDQAKGLTLVTPRNTVFGAWQNGGYQGDWLSANCSYVTAKDNLNLDIVGTYQQDAYIIVGSRAEALTKIATIQKDNSFNFDFTQDNHRWSNGDGAMRRVNGKLVFDIGTPNHDNAQYNTAAVDSPYRHYNASAIPAIDFRMAVTNNVSTLQLRWHRMDNGVIHEYVKPKTLIGDGNERKYTVSTSDPNFNGDIISIGIKGVDGIPASTKLTLITATVHQ